MKNFAEFVADIADDAVRGLGGVVQVPNARALASMISERLRATGNSAGAPDVAGRGWSVSVAVRQGVVVCTMQHRDHWYTKEDLEARITTIPAVTNAELTGHGFSAAFVYFVTEGRRHIDEVRYWCGDPNESWRYYVTPEIERPRQLWSTNADPTILRLYHDDVGYQVIGHSETAIATTLLAAVMDAEDWEDEVDTRRRLRDLAAAMGYRHFDALDAFFASSDSDDLSELIHRLEGDVRGG